MNSKLNLAGTLPLIIVLGVVTAFDAMAIDMYLPAFSAIGHSLQTDAGVMQTSLSIFLVSLAIGQFFFGLLADRFGRRMPLIAGIILFIAASILAALAQDVTTFMIARFLQGLGGAAGLVIPRALVADLYEPRDGAKVFSLLMQVMMVAPIMAPPLGGLLLELFGWRSIFLALAIIGLFGLIASIRLVPESLPPASRRKIGVLPVLVSYAGLLGNGRFCGYMLSGSFTMAGLFAYIGSSAFIFIEYYGLSPAIYSIVFAGIALGEILMGFVNIRLLGRWKERQILPVGLWLHVSFMTLLALAVLIGWTGIEIVAPLLFLALVSLSLIFGNVTAMVMERAPGSSGSASGLFGVVQYVFAGAIGIILGLAHDATLVPPVAVMLACAAGALLTWWLASLLDAAARPSPAE